MGQVDPGVNGEARYSSGFCDLLGRFASGRESAP